MEINKKNIWQYYPKAYAAITPQMQLALLEEAGKYASGKTIDAGTGVGKLVPFLLNNQRVQNILGVDYEEEMLKEAKNEYVHKNINFVRGDVCSLPVKDSSVDTITSINVLYALQSPTGFLQESFRGLKSNGTLILSSPNKTLKDKRSSLEQALVSEMQFNPHFPLFIKCNQFLTSSFEPILFESATLCELLETIGFNIVEEDNSHYLGANYFIVARKN